jgi:hypothetical protein
LQLSQGIVCRPGINCLLSLGALCTGYQTFLSIRLKAACSANPSTQFIGVGWNLNLTRLSGIYISPYGHKYIFC